MKQRSTKSYNSLLRKIDKQKLVITQKGKCIYCGERFSRPRVAGKRKKFMTFDHYIPLSKGGDHSENNIVLACFACNQEKGDCMPSLSKEELLNKINNL